MHKVILFKDNTKCLTVLFRVLGKLFEKLACQTYFIYFDLLLQINNCCVNKTQIRTVEDIFFIINCR